MALSDLLWPKWKHGTSAERTAAVQKLTNQKVIARVAKTDSDWLVREAAMKKLTNQAVLADVAKTANDYSCRLDAVKKLTDQAALADVAKTANDFSCRWDAVKKLTDQAALADVAKTDSEPIVRNEAVIRLTDQAALADVAKTASDGSVRTEAARMLADKSLAQAIYADVAKSVSDRQQHGWVAMEQLTNQAALADVAKTASDGSVRMKAANRLADESLAQALYADIAKTASDFSCRWDAVRKLTDQAALADVAKTDSEPTVRRAAVIRLTDQAVLAEVAKRDSERAIRMAAADRLTDQAVLAEIARTAADRFVRVNAAARLEDRTLARATYDELAKTNIDGTPVPWEPKNGSDCVVLSIALRMKWIGPGAFVMGNGEDPTYHVQHPSSASAPRTERIAEGFWIGEHQITQGQWKLLGYGLNDKAYEVDLAFGRYVRDDDCPVVRISWYEAVDFCKTLTALERAAGRLSQDLEFRLPSESQWEYSCRAGGTTAYAGSLEELGWSARNSDGKLHRVKEKRPNAWQLFDMHGNVWEWCDDWGVGGGRVRRGGGFRTRPEWCTSFERGSYRPGSDDSDENGFRIVLVKSGGTPTSTTVAARSE